MKWILVLCSAVLAYEPAVWLTKTWFDDTWGSFGEWVFLVIVGLVVASFRSSKAELDGRAWKLFAVSAAARLIGKLLAINVIGALALVVDMYAIGRLLQLDKRRFALSPLALSTLFALTLPIERILQRVLGFHLQHGSAAVAESILKVFYNDVTRTGIDLTIGTAHVLIDVPCSGARGMTITAVIFMALVAVVRPKFPSLFVGAVVAVAGCLFSNIGRITTLAIGIVEGVNVMSQPLHDIIGLTWLSISFSMLVLWSRHVPETETPSALTPTQKNPVSPYWAAFAVAACLALLVVPERPIDASRPVQDIALPVSFGTWMAESRELTAQESRYLKKYGGDAAKATYGAFTLMGIRTSSPLRHLHSPEACLRGSGFEVERLGIDFDRPMPATVYRAERNGRIYSIEVTYLSSNGDIVTNVSEAVSRWMTDTTTEWTAVQRISPWASNPTTRKQFDQKLKQHFLSRTL